MATIQVSVVTALGTTISAETSFPVREVVVITRKPKRGHYELTFKVIEQGPVPSAGIVMLVIVLEEIVVNQ